MRFPVILLRVAIALLTEPAWAQDQPLCVHDGTGCFFEKAAPSHWNAEPIFQSSPGRVIFQPTYVVCPICAFITRQYLFAFSVEIREPQTRQYDMTAIDKASQLVQSVFGISAAEVLTLFTDTTSIGWIDEPNAICRAHKKRPSPILDRPYFEDVEYCLRLISANGLQFKYEHPDYYGDGREVPRSPNIFRIQSSATVAITKNPGSAYREPAPDEIAPYGAVLVKLIASTKTLMVAEMKAKGLFVENEKGPGASRITRGSW
jgi:hypothetical protein